MIESLITVSLVGGLVGFIFSMPVAGPISILITSHSLKGQFRFSLMAALGAAIVDFIYCFLAIFGFTQLFETYAPYIPLILAIGGIIIIFIGFRIFRTQIDFNHIEEQIHLPQRIQRLEKRSGFFSGLLINLFNPTLLIGWLTSSFIVLSMAASFGLNVGGLDAIIGKNVQSLNEHESTESSALNNEMDIDNLQKYLDQTDSRTEEEFSLSRWTVVLSIGYAAFVALGTIIWFYILTRFLTRNRKNIRLNILNTLIRGLGVFLILFGMYLILKLLLPLVA